MNSFNKLLYSLAALWRRCGGT